MNLRFWASMIVIYLVGYELAYSQYGLRPRGDVNCDWAVNIADLNVLIDSIMKDAHYHSFYGYAADVNNDHDINISDINLVISAILGQRVSPMPSYSGTLPVLYVNTAGHQDIVSKEEYIDADWWLDNMGLEGYESIGSAQAPLGMLIKGRGNYSWNHYDKKSFRIKLGEKQPLMGMHSNRHFCLLAHPDDFLAYLKNTMGFELSRRIGLNYTPAQEPVEVVLNGQYIGLYFLTEKIRVGKHRVNIEEQMDGETDSHKITGGWLLETPNGLDDNSTLWFLEQPDDDIWFAVIPQSPEILSEQQIEYIRNYIQQANEAIYTQDKTSTEWEKYIDIDTLAMYYIVGEIMDDLEYFAGSCYMYKHRGDSTKLIFGPVWDFGSAFQRWAIYQDTQFNKFIYEAPTPFTTSHWIAEIVKFPHFQQVLREHWQSFYRQGFNGLDMNQYMDAFVNKIRSAFDCELQRWPNYYNNIDRQKTEFSNFIHRKIDWLDSQWGKPQSSSILSSTRSN